MLLNFHFFVLVRLLVVKAILNEEKSLAKVSLLYGNYTDPGIVELKIEAFGEVYDIALTPVLQTSHHSLNANLDKNGTRRLLKDVDQLMNYKYFTDAHFMKSEHAIVRMQEINGHLYVQGKLKDNSRIEFKTATNTSYAPIHIMYRVVELNAAFKKTNENAYNNFNLSATWGKSVDVDEDRLLSSEVENEINPKLLLVLDYKITKYFQSEERNIDLANYLSIFLNSVNHRYSSMKNPKIRVVLTGVIQTQKRRDQPFVVHPPADFEITTNGVNERIVMDAKDCVVDDQTLENFNSWLNEMKDQIKRPYDVAIWLTGMNIANYNGKEYDVSTQGFSYVGTVCEDFNVAIVKDKLGTFHAVSFLTHEMAHLFGASHDGENFQLLDDMPTAEDCPWSDGYIMSYVFTSHNSFFFSSCSGKQMAFVLNLRKDRLETNPPEIELPIDTRFPGELQTPDDQCRTTLHPLCTFASSRKEVMCMRLICKCAGTEFLKTIEPALEGTECDSGKWCFKGDCVKKDTRHRYTSQVSNDDRKMMKFVRKRLRNKDAKKKSTSKSTDPKKNQEVQNAQKIKLRKPKQKEQPTNAME